MGLEINNIRAECVSTLGFGRAYTSNDPPCVRCTPGGHVSDPEVLGGGSLLPSEPGGGRAPQPPSPPAPRHPHLPLGDGQATKSTGTAQGVDSQQT